MQYQTLRVRGEDSVRIVQIYRPEIANKLNILCMEELVSALRDAAEERDCHSVVLRGLPDCFCSGGELGDFRK